MKIEIGDNVTIIIGVIIVCIFIYFGFCDNHYFHEGIGSTIHKTEQETK